MCKTRDAAWQVENRLAIYHVCDSKECKRRLKEDHLFSFHEYKWTRL